MKQERAEYLAELDIPLSPLEMLFDALAIAGTLALIIMTVYYWPYMPEIVPSHFDASGQVNGWSSRSSMLALPIIGVFMVVLMEVLCRFPKIYNYPVKITPDNAARQFLLARTLLKYIAAMIACLFAYIVWMTSRVALGQISGGTPYDFIIIIAASIAPTIVYFIAAARAR